MDSTAEAPWAPFALACGESAERRIGPLSLRLRRTELEWHAAFARPPAAAGEVDDDADGWMICEGDCDDLNAAVNPGVIESKDVGNCADGIDNDCDGLADTDPECKGCFIGVVM